MLDSFVISASCADTPAPIPLPVGAPASGLTSSGAPFGSFSLHGLNHSAFDAEAKRSRGRFTRPSFRLGQMINRLLKQTGLTPDCIRGPRSGLVSGSQFGCAQVYDMHSRLRRFGPRGIDAVRFAQATHNYPISAAAIDFGLQGPCLAVVSTALAGLDALQCAFDWLRDDRCDRVLVAAYEDFAPPLTTHLAQRCRANPTKSYGEAMVIVLLERPALAAARGLENLPMLSVSSAKMESGPGKNQNLGQGQGTTLDLCPDGIDYLGASGLVALHHLLNRSLVQQRGAEPLRLHLPGLATTGIGLTLTIANHEMELS